MLSVRLQRVGRKNDPSFRVVIIDSKKSVKSRNYIEMVGSYNPRQKSVDLKADRIKHWIAEGAKPTDTVHNILLNQKVIEGKKVNPLGKKTPIVKEVKEEEVKEAKSEATDNTPTDTKAEETPTEDKKEEDAPKEETPTEDVKEEPKPEETPTETKEEPVETPTEDNAETDTKKVS